MMPRQNEGSIMIKRESGENPEQTRCCIRTETHSASPVAEIDFQSLTVNIPLGRPAATAISQKTCLVLFSEAFKE